MLLSVGMIVKNEEKYLESCLSALKPMLENLDSELIIADTGSTDNTVEIAKKFTDKVYYFEWINDFSAARNFTLEKSSGEWFMFIDADEVIRSCDALISFFKSGKYKSYGCASYIVRSVIDEDDPSRYTDNTVLRLTKRYDDVHFENAVHEAISPLYQPIMHLDIIADHYGYYFNKGGLPTKQAYQKSKRNLELLLNSFPDSESNYSIYKEIADCYEIIGDWKNVLKYVNMGFERLSHSHIAITQYYDYKADIALREGRYQEVIEVCDDYFNSSNEFRKGALASDTDMYSFRGQAHYFNKAYDKAISDLQCFFKVYREYRSGRLKTDDLLYNQIQMKDSSLKTLCKMLFESYIALGKYNTAADSFKLLPLEVCADDESYMFNHFIMRADVMEHTHYSGIKKYALQLDEVNRDRFFRTLKWKLFSSKKPEELIKALSEAKGISSELDDALKIYESHFIRKNASSAQIGEFVKKYGSYRNENILYIMLSENIDIAPFLLSEDFNVYVCSGILLSDYPDYIELLEVYDVSKISSSALAIAETFWGRAMAEANNAQKSVLRLFEKYGEIAAKWRMAFPNEENISAELKAGIIISGITDAYSRKDYQTCVNELRSLVNNYKEFAPFASQYLEMINVETAPPKNDPMAELRQLAVVVKQNINAMLNAGQISQAEQTLLELEKLCPDDTDIILLKEKIKSRKLL